MYALSDFQSQLASESLQSRGDVNNTRASDKLFREGLNQLRDNDCFGLVDAERARGRQVNQLISVNELDLFVGGSLFLENLDDPELQGPFVLHWRMFISVKKRSSRPLLSNLLIDPEDNEFLGAVGLQVPADLDVLEELSPFSLCPLSFAALLAHKVQQKLVCRALGGRFLGFYGLLPEGDPTIDCLLEGFI